MNTEEFKECVRAVLECLDDTQDTAGTSKICIESDHESTIPGEQILKQVKTLHRIGAVAYLLKLEVFDSFKNTVVSIDGFEDYFKPEDLRKRQIVEE